MRALAVWIIRGYRAALVPFFGPSCRFEPSCSRYAEEAIRSHGLWRGAGLAAARICRCHPFSRGGLDLVPAAAAAKDIDRPSTAPMRMRTDAGAHG